MATAGKIPFLGFKALVKNLVWLGFGASASAAIADAYFTDADLEFAVAAQDREFVVDIQDREFLVTPVDREFAS